MRRLALVVVGLVTAIALILAAVVLGGSTSTEATLATTPQRAGTLAPPPPTSATTSTSSPSMTSTPALTLQPTTYLVWVSGGLPLEFVTGLVEAFDRVSIVKADAVELAAPGGTVISLDALALDPAAHRPFDQYQRLAPLRPGSVILGKTSGELRQAVVGDELIVAGTPFEIAAIVPDEVVAAAEVVFSLFDPSLPVSTYRYALIATEMPRIEFESVVRSLSDGVPVRIRGEGEVPWLRHADGVLPQVLIKQALGEFSYANRTGTGTDFDQSSSFMDEEIVTTQVPIVGEVVCHGVVAEMLVGAMTQLMDKGLTDLVDPGGFAGCWYPRFVRTASGSPAGVSRHAWGAAVDINAPANPFGSEGTQDPRLVEVMQAWGFIWGGNWLVPDPMHFEYGGGR